MELPRDDYVVEVRETHATPPASDVVRVTRPTKIIVEPGSDDAMAGGAILGTVGILAMVVGTAMGLGCWGDGSSRRECGPAGAVFVGGAVATAAGWTIFGVWHTHVRAEAWSPVLPNVSLTPGGGSVGWSFAF